MFGGWLAPWSILLARLLHKIHLFTSRAGMRFYMRFIEYVIFSNCVTSLTIPCYESQPSRVDRPRKPRGRFYIAYQISENLAPYLS